MCAAQSDGPVPPLLGHELGVSAHKRNTQRPFQLAPPVNPNQQSDINAKNRVLSRPTNTWEGIRYLKKGV